MPGTELRKGERTRRWILERAAPVFNERGYAGASMSELMAATGLEKGGLYNHFGSKEALALAAFDYSIERITDAFVRAQRGKEGLDRLLAVVSAFSRWYDRPVIPGGCPIMNTAIECDDTNPELAAHAREAMESWHRLIGSIVKEAKARGEIEADVDPYELAAVVTSTLEGALMLSRLFGDARHMRRAVAHLTRHIEGLRRRVGRSPRRRAPGSKPREEVGR